VIQKEAQHILKYEDPTIEVRSIWNGKTKVIPIIIIIGATGIISKPLIKYLSNIPVQHDIQALQKTAILGTANILRRVLT
jgi:hypothetical protein